MRYCVSQCITFQHSAFAKTFEKAHTHTQIASVFEFIGAIVLGRVSTATIAGGIAGVYHQNEALQL